MREWFRLHKRRPKPRLPAPFPCVKTQGSRQNLTKRGFSSRKTTTKRITAFQEMPTRQFKKFVTSFTQPSRSMPDGTCLSPWDGSNSSVYYSRSNMPWKQPSYNIGQGKCDEPGVVYDEADEWVGRAQTDRHPAPIQVAWNPFSYFQLLEKGGWNIADFSEHLQDVINMSSIGLCVFQKKSWSLSPENGKGEKCFSSLLFL